MAESTVNVTTQGLLIGLVVTAIVAVAAVSIGSYALYSVENPSGGSSGGDIDGSSLDVADGSLNVTDERMLVDVPAVFASSLRADTIVANIEMDDIDVATAVVRESLTAGDALSSTSTSATLGTFVATSGSVSTPGFTANASTAKFGPLKASDGDTITAAIYNITADDFAAGVQLSANLTAAQFGALTATNAGVTGGVINITGSQFTAGPLLADATSVSTTNNNFTLGTNMTSTDGAITFGVNLASFNNISVSNLATIGNVTVYDKFETDDPLMQLNLDATDSVDIGWYAAAESGNPTSNGVAAIYDTSSQSFTFLQGIDLSAPINGTIPTGTPAVVTTGTVMPTKIMTTNYTNEPTTRAVFDINSGTGWGARISTASDRQGWSTASYMYGFGAELTNGNAQVNCLSDGGNIRSAGVLYTDAALMLGVYNQSSVASNVSVDKDVFRRVTVGANSTTFHTQTLVDSDVFADFELISNNTTSTADVARMTIKSSEGRASSLRFESTQTSNPMFTIERVYNGSSAIQELQFRAWSNFSDINSFANVITVRNDNRIGISNADFTGVPAAGDNIVIGGNTGTNGITIRSSSASTNGGLYFMDSAIEGSMTFNHSNNTLTTEVGDTTSSINTSNVTIQRDTADNGGQQLAVRNAGTGSAGIAFIDAAFPAGSNWQVFSEFNSASDSTFKIGRASTGDYLTIDESGNVALPESVRSIAGATAPGSTGEVAWDEEWLSVCTAANTWRFAQLTTAKIPGGAGETGAGIVATFQGNNAGTVWGAIGVNVSFDPSITEWEVPAGLSLYIVEVKAFARLSNDGAFTCTFRTAINGTGDSTTSTAATETSKQVAWSPANSTLNAGDTLEIQINTGSISPNTMLTYVNVIGTYVSS